MGQVVRRRWEVDKDRPRGPNMWSLGQTPQSSVVQLMAVCQNCGKENAPKAAVCTECGTQLAVERRANLAGTMLGMPSPIAQGAPPAAAPENAAAAQKSPDPAAATRRAFAGTMIGMPMPVVTEARPHAEPPPRAPLIPSGKSADFGKTMVGMGAQAPLASATRPAAIEPGVTRPGAIERGVTEPAPQEPLDHNVEPGGPPNRKFQGTLLGVARPGIAPSLSSAKAPPSASPALPQSSTPIAEPRVFSEHVEKPFPTTRPLWKNATMIALGMLAAGAIGGTFALLSPKPVTVVVEEFAIDEEGNDQLKLKCDECPEGSELILGEAKAPVSNHHAVLTPRKPLALGRNELEFVLHADGKLRDAKKVILPIAFRVLTKWTGLHENPPHAEISVAAPEGSNVLIGGEVAPLTAEKAIRRVDFARETSGESAKVTRVESVYDVIVTVDGKARETKAELKNGVTPLTLTSPGTVHQLGGKPVAISGRSASHATIKIGDVQIKADDKGLFSHLLESPEPGKILVIASSDNFLSRRVEIELSKNAPEPTDAVTKFSEVAPGVSVNLKVNVIESRTAGGTTQALVEVENGCDAPPCLLRAVYGEPKKLPPNKAVRLSGTVAPGSPLTVKVSRFR